MADPIGGAVPPGGFPAQGGAASPRSMAPAEVNDALKSMASSMDTQNQLMRELLKNFERVQRSATDINKEMAFGHTELRTLLKDTANLAFSMKRIQELKSSKVAAGSTQSGTLVYVKNLERESKILLQTLNAGKGQGKFVAEVKKELEAYDKILKKVGKQGDKTWDDKQIREVNDELKIAGQNVAELQKRMERIKVAKVTDGFKQLGRAIDDAFDNRFLAAMSRTPGLGGFMKVMGAKTRIDAARSDISQKLGERSKLRQDSLKANAADVHAKFGAGGTRVLRQMGYTGGLPGDPQHGVRGKRTIHRPGTTAASAQAAGGALEQMTVKTLTVQNMSGPGLSSGGGVRNKRWNKKNRGGRNLTVSPDAGADLPAPSSAGWAIPGRGNRYRGKTTLGPRPSAGGTPSTDEVSDIMQGPTGLMGRMTNKIVNKMASGDGAMAKWAQGRIAAGAGSGAAGMAEGALGMGGGLARGALGLASKAAVPIAIATALIQLRDKVATDNKETHEALAGGGLYAGGQSVNRSYQNARNTLMSTGFSNAAQLGVTKQTNMALMGGLQEQGWGVGGTMSKKQGTAGSVDLGQSLEDHTGIAGGGFYGAMMQNTVYSGKNMGMSQDTSSRLTLKLIEKFGQTTQATKEFFLNLDDMMQSSGISASKYVEAIDAVTDNFDVMNKSLTGTVSILTTLGKTGRMTGDQLKDVLQQVTRPNQMSTAQRAYAFKTMTPEDIKAAVEGEQGTIEADLRALNKQLAKNGISGKLSSDFGNQGDIENAINQSGLDAETKKATIKAIGDTKTRVTSAQARIQGVQSGDAVQAAASVDNSGESSTTAWLSRKSRLRSLAKMAGVDIDKLLGGDQASMTKFLNSKPVSQAGDTFGSDGKGSAQSDIYGFNGLTRAGAVSAVSLANEKVDWNHPGVEAGPNATPAERARAQSETDRHSAMWNTMRDLQRARDPLGSKGQSADQLVKTFRQDAKNSPGKLADELAQNSETLRMLLNPNSPLNQANGNIADLSKEMESAAKARDIADKTRTTADVFASAFEYLFNKLINLLTPIMDIMKFNWGNKDKEANAQKDRDNRVSRKEALSDTLEGLTGGDHLRGEDLKKWKADKAAAAKDLKDLDANDKNYWPKQQKIQERVRELAKRSGEGTSALDAEKERLAQEALAGNRGDATNPAYAGTYAAQHAKRWNIIGGLKDVERNGRWDQTTSDEAPGTDPDIADGHGRDLADAVGHGSLNERKLGFADTFGNDQFYGIKGIRDANNQVVGAQAEVGSAGASVLAGMSKHSPGEYRAEQNTSGGKTYITYYMTTTNPTVPQGAAASNQQPPAVKGGQG